MEIKEGDLIKISIDNVKKYDNMPPYIKLVNKIIKDGQGKPYVASVEKDTIKIRAWKFDFRGDVTIPKNAIIRVVGNDKNYQLKR